MRLITLTDDDGVIVQRAVSTEEWATISGVQLAALLFPAPTASDVATVNEFLDHCREGTS
jgi:hypothetical protein